jgi:uncharacterized repeat protein (TIGR03843 family)
VTTDENGVLALSPERILRLLSEGEVEVEGLIPWSSNATLLVTVRDEELSSLAVYKPQDGERPLWDFRPGTLGMRETAAFLLSEALGWGLVPPTVMREGPYGLGSVQFYVHSQEDAHFFTIQEDSGYDSDLMRLAVFDAISNNADRKAGHCLVDLEGRLWAIDNALCFHEEAKLRTVIWDYARETLPPQIVADLHALRPALEAGAPVRSALDRLLSKAEVAALHRRLDRLLEAGRFPEPGPERAIPWPVF